MDPATSATTVSNIPELPELPDVLAAVGSWAAVEVVKVVSRGRPWERDVRRALPIVVLGIGAAIRVCASALVGGQDWRTSALRGVIAGVVAVYLHQVKRATADGDVRVAGM